MRRGGATIRGNRNPPPTPAEGVSIPVNPAGLTDVEVRESLARWHNDAGSGYDCPSQLAEYSEGKPTGSQHG